VAFGVAKRLVACALCMSACGEHGSGERVDDTQAGLSESVKDVVTTREGDAGAERNLTLSDRLVGHYGLRQRVAGKADALGMELKSLATTYALVDLYEREGRIVWSQRSCRSLFEHEPRDTTVSLTDKAVRSTPPFESELVLHEQGETVRWERAESLVASGFHDQEPRAPLPSSESDARVYDQDGDGRPGVTSHVKTRVLFADIEGDAYLVERSRTSMKGLLENGRLVGEVFHARESRVLGATNLLLKIPLPARPDLGREHSVVLVPLFEELSCDELVEQTDTLFTP
jgi:hypothetical protein